MRNSADLAAGSESVVREFLKACTAAACGGMRRGEILALRCRTTRDVIVWRMSATWLHISDFQIRAGDSYDRDVVLQALVGAVADYPVLGRAPDLIFAAGDIAHAGKPEEYRLASKFFSSGTKPGPRRHPKVIFADLEHARREELGFSVGLVDKATQTELREHQESL